MVTPSAANKHQQSHAGQSGEPLIPRGTTRGIALVPRPAPAANTVPVLRFVQVPATRVADIRITGFPGATAGIASWWTARHQPHRCALQGAPYSDSSMAGWSSSQSWPSRPALVTFVPGPLPPARAGHRAGLDLREVAVPGPPTLPVSGTRLCRASQHSQESSKSVPRFTQVIGTAGAATLPEGDRDSPRAGPGSPRLPGRPGSRLCLGLVWPSLLRFVGWLCGSCRSSMWACCWACRRLSAAGSGLPPELQPCSLRPMD